VTGLNKGRFLMAPAALILLAALFCGVVGVQKLLDRRYDHARIEKILYLPNGKFLKPAVLGFDTVAADYYWLRTIGYFGGHYMADKKYPWMAHILDLVTDLDPRFRIVYYFGGIVLALEAEQPEESTALLKKGMRQFPDYWKFPFFVGFNYFYYQADFASAAEYISLAASLPGRPEYLPRLAASLWARAGKTDDAVAFLRTVEAAVDDERVKENLRKKIADLEAGIVPDSLDRAINAQGDWYAW
jgi:hypothetical protein